MTVLTTARSSLDAATTTPAMLTAAAAAFQALSDVCLAADPTCLQFPAFAYAGQAAAEGLAELRSIAPEAVAAGHPEPSGPDADEAARLGYRLHSVLIDAAHRIDVLEIRLALLDAAQAASRVSRLLEK